MKKNPSRKFIYILALLLVPLVTICSCERPRRHEYSHNLAYEPLVGINIITDGQGLRDLDGIARAFARRGNFEIQDGNFLLDGGNLKLNLTIWVGRDSFVHVTNLLTPYRVYIFVYSHDSIGEWEPSWKNLLNQLSGRFRLESVKIDALGSQPTS